MAGSIRCGKELNTLPILGGCPSDSEYFLVVNAVGGYGAGGYALRSWGNLVLCLLESGIFLVYGNELVDGAYENTDYVGIELVVFYNGINRYLIPTTEYTIIETGGFQINTDIFGSVFTEADVFVVFPNGPTT